MEAHTVLTLLAAHTPVDATEADAAARIQQLVTSTPRFWHRATPGGHVTASAWVLSPDRSQVLLTHHRKLGKWLQLGGHVEADATPLAAALREAREESGLAAVQPLHEALFDVDVHAIPATPTEPAHEHHDLRFALVADPTAPLQVTSESKALQWVSLDQVAGLCDSEESLMRMVRKTAAGSV